MNNLRIIFMGNAMRGAVSLEKLLDANKNVVLVVIHSENLNQNPTPWDADIRTIAENYKIPVISPEKINSSESIKELKSFNPNLIVLGSYSPILSDKILEIPSLGVLNQHGGPLPKYRGSSPINWAIINGETKGACTIMFAEKGIDTGDILAQEEFEIKLTDTILSIHEKTFKIFPRLLLNVINQIEQDTLVRHPQNNDESFYYHARKPRDGVIFWDRMTAMEVYNKVRALTHPFPGAHTFYEGKMIKIWKASLLDEDIRGIPGRVCFRRKKGVVVITKNRALLIETIQEDGKDSIPANEYFTRLGVDLGS